MNVHVGLVLLCEGQVDVRLIAGADDIVLHIAHDADDLGLDRRLLRSVGCAEPDSLPDGIAVRPELLRRGLVEDDYRRPAGSLTLLEAAPAEHGNAQGGE